jgi:quinol monooxygenase YgiN
MQATIIFLDHSKEAESLCSALVEHTNALNGEGFISCDYSVDPDNSGRAVFTIPDDENADDWADVLTMNTAMWGENLATKVWLNDITA